MNQDKPYNPLDKVNLGRSVAEALLQRPLVSMAELKPFDGAGSYAMYYVGDFEPYQPISEKNKEGKFELPIYVGKAVPEGARKGVYSIDAKPGKVMFKRLREHAKSITQVAHLDLKDFYCRYLVVDDIWIPLGESLLIAQFSPLWNVVIDGFGNHTPGKGRYKQARSLWDTLHPGRPWAMKCQERAETQEQIVGMLNKEFGFR